MWSLHVLRWITVFVLTLGLSDFGIPKPFAFYAFEDRTLTTTISCVHHELVVALVDFIYNLAGRYGGRRIVALVAFICLYLIVSLSTWQFWRV